MSLQCYSKPCVLLIAICLGILQNLFEEQLTENIPSCLSFSSSNMYVKQAN